MTIRFRSALVAAAIFSLGAVISPAAPHAAAAQAGPASCVAPAATGDPVAVSGNGRSSSAPFALAGGAYRVDWGMRQPGPGARGASLDLYAADAEDSTRWRSIVLSPALGPNGDAVDETYVYTVKPGSYFVKADVPGEWFVRLTPIAP